MAFGQQGGSRQNGRRAKGKRKGRKAPLAASRVFAPMLGLWGALLGGLTTLAVAPPVFAGAIRGTLIATLGVPSQPALAAFMALALGAALFACAAVLHHRTRGRVRGAALAEHAARRVRPIDPLRDLGTRSLDDPLEAMPFATSAWRDADLDGQDTGAPVAEARAQAAPETAPRVLDLAEFGQLPGRNGVWVEETAAPAAPAAAAAPPAPAADAPAAPAPATTAARKTPEARARKASGAAFVSALRAVRPEAPRPAPGTAALARLRAVPPSELSLLEMVERFAGALHEHRAASPARALDASELAAREVALAEALKALAALSADTAARGVAVRGEAALQEAPAGLQAQRRMERGAA